MLLRARPTPAASRSTFGFILPVVVVAVTFVAFLPVLDAGFLNWDDDVNLLDNPRYRGLGWTQLRWMFTTMLLGHYIPITWMSFGLNYVLGGMNPWGYHLGNLLLHATNAGLFYLVARRLLAAAFGKAVAVPFLPREGGAEPDVALSVGAAFAALVFGVHPLRVESVAWVTERRDVLCGLFSLLTVLAYLTAHRRGRPVRLHTGWYWTAVGCFALALLSKSMVVSLPLALLVIDIYPLGRMSFAAPEWRARAGRLVVEKLPFLALSAAISVTMVAVGQRQQIMTSLKTLGVAERLAISGYGLIFYLWTSVVPWPLSPFYELPYRVMPLSPRYLLPAAAVVIITVAVILARRRWPAGLAVWLAYVLLLLPVIGIIHNGRQIAADRYSYLSGLEFGVLAGGALAWLQRERGRLKAWVVSAAVLVAVLVIVGWAAAACRQSKIWHDMETLWRWAQEVDPDCAVCNINLGAELVASPARDPQRALEAEALFRHAITLRPDRDFAYHGLGVALVLQRRYDEAERAFREYMKRDPSSAIGVADLGLLRLSQNRYGEAIPLLRRALAMAPGVPRLTAELARAMREWGEELRRQGKGGEADALLSEIGALQGKPPEDAVRSSQRSATTTGR